MYLDDAINRINQIEWEKLGKTMGCNEVDLAHAYLQKIAQFVSKQALKSNVNPLLINVASVLGDRTEINYIEYCDEAVQQALVNKTLPRHILNFYLQLANYADNNSVEQYLQIYEPLIQLLERGFVFAFREGGLIVNNVGFYPLDGWYERFLNLSPM